MSAPTGSLAGRVVVVTGAGSGIGAATAYRLAADGAQVRLWDLDAEAVQQVAAAVGAGSTAATVDVADPDAVRHAFDAVLRADGRVDGLAHVAGIDGSPRLRRHVADVIASSTGEPEFDVLGHISDQDWREVMRVNLDGTFHCVRGAVAAMLPRRSGAIVTISSAAGIDPSPFNPHYAAAKAGSRALTMAVAKSVAAQGIRVNCVAPGATETPMLDRMASTGRRRAPIPIGRVAQPAEVASVIAFLLGDGASYVVGETVNVNGGMLTR